MIGTITYILARAGWRAMNGQLADERRRLAGAEPPSAYVSYDPRLLGGVGWYGYRIAFNGGDRQMIERARYMLSERYTIRDSYDNYFNGVYVIGVLLRQRVPHYGIGGGAPAPEPDVLNFYMPNGGTISLNKTGSPTVVELEYSIDRGKTWAVWQPDNNGNRSLTLTAGQCMYVRNTSETKTMFSTRYNDYYQFAFTNSVYSNGNCNSLLSKYTEVVTEAPSNCFVHLFEDCSTLITPPTLPSVVVNAGSYNNMFSRCSQLTIAPELPAMQINKNCYEGMFSFCVLLEESPILHAEILYKECYYGMFVGCSSLRSVKTKMIDISASNCIGSWLSNVSPTGDFYCDQNLTIPTGSSGIPSGWTRHDI